MTAGAEFLRRQTERFLVQLTVDRALKPDEVGELVTMAAFDQRLILAADIYAGPHQMLGVVQLLVAADDSTHANKLAYQLVDQVVPGALVIESTVTPVHNPIGADGADPFDLPTT